MRYLLPIFLCLSLTACEVSWLAADSRDIKTKGYSVTVKDKPTEDGGYDILAMHCLTCIGAGYREAQEAAVTQRMGEVCGRGKVVERQRFWNGGLLNVRFQCS